KGKAILNNPFLNKGTAFSLAERADLEIEGLLPSAVQTLAQQIEVTYAQLSQLEGRYAKNKFLMNLYNTNRILYYALVGEHVKELLPVIYTPTIADSVREFSTDFVRPNDAVYLDVNHPETIEAVLKNASHDLEQVDLLVITDGEGVLGIGDWGVQGVMISVGKLAVYTVAAGMDPRRVLPIVIDNGTNRKELLEDPNYLGNRQERKTGQEYWDYIDQFVTTAKTLFPKVLFHWEDFGRGNASVILEKYRNEVTTFNDDIQGTGVMMSAALNSVAEVTKKPVQDHTFVIFGAGTAGIGVTEQIKLEMTLNGLSEEEANKRFYLVDRFGLVTKDQENLTEGQQRFARDKSEFEGSVSTLAEVIKAVKPSVLIGTSGQAGSFTKEIIEDMASFNERPAILPISNPTDLQEATAKDILTFTNGRGLVVTGSPSEPVTIGDVTYHIGQANNALLYPGLGLGIVISKASTVTDSMLSAAAHGIANFQDLSQPGMALLPPLDAVRPASKAVAMAVVNAAIKDGVATQEIQDVEQAVDSAVWKATYQN
ncbi:NAD-dependent malic enzyme, partial [uncultured Enterococcus sp.]|uniref:NAD-dependent malic enzyme n=1 Tax=uncultured Enterococcus sp. TaxID=167972 RepID=UPI0025DB2A46